MPAHPFGQGLGYASWQLADREVGPTIDADTDGEVRLAVTNTGRRPGLVGRSCRSTCPTRQRHRPSRPLLAAFATVRAEAGQTVPVTIALPARALADWQKDGGHHEPGAVDVLVGSSVVELPLRGRTDVSR